MQQIEIITRWDVGQGIRLENFRSMAKNPLYSFNYKNIAVMEEYPRVLRKITINNVYKSIDLENWIKQSDIEPTKADVNLQQHSAGMIFSEFILLTKKIPDYYRLIYLAGQLYHIYITKDWIIFGGVKSTQVGNFLPIPT